MATSVTRSIGGGNMSPPMGSFRYTADINSPKHGGGNTMNLSDDALVSPLASVDTGSGGFNDTKEEPLNSTSTNGSSATFTVRSVVPSNTSATTNESTTVSPGPTGALRQTPPSTPSQQRNILPYRSTTTNNNNSNDASSTPAPSQHTSGNEHEVPAALAALLHQTDKTGKHQSKATPHVGSPSSISSTSAVSSTSSIPFPPLSPGTTSNTSNTIVSSNASSSSSSSSSMGKYNPIHDNHSSSSSHVSSSSASSSTGNRGIFSAFCCFSPAAVPVDVNATTALVSNTESSTTDHSLAHSDTTASSMNQRYSDNPSSPSDHSNTTTTRNSSSSAVSPSSGNNTSSSSSSSNRPTLSLNISSRSLQSNNFAGTETPSRRRLVNGRSGEDTPSKVLSPTSLTVRSTMELYGKQAVPPWGSQHPAIVHANIMAHSHGRQFSSPYQMKGKMNNNSNNNGYAFGNSGGTGYHYPSSLGYNPAATPNGAATPGGPGVPSSKKKVKRTGPRPLPPVVRINNVRRPASTVGEGPLLAPLLDCDLGKPCLVLDLDETLVHSSFKPVPNSDYILPVEIEGIVHHVYVIKRPGCDEFLERLGKTYEIVIFTASLAKYADPLLDLLDKTNVIRARLFREACVYHEGNYVKDLSLLGRDPRYTIIVDNSPASYLFQPENALACDSFIDDLKDTELYVLHDFLQSVRRVKDVRPMLHQWATGTYKGVMNEEIHSDSDGEGGGASMYHPHLDFYEADSGSNGDNENGAYDDRDGATIGKFSSHNESFEFSSDDDNNNTKNMMNGGSSKNKLVNKFDAVNSPTRIPSNGKLLTSTTR